MFQVALTNVLMDLKSTYSTSLVKHHHYLPLFKSLSVYLTSLSSSISRLSLSLYPCPYTYILNNQFPSSLTHHHHFSFFKPVLSSLSLPTRLPHHFWNPTLFNTQSLSLSKLRELHPCSHFDSPTNPTPKIIYLESLRLKDPENVLACIIGPL